MSEISTTDDVIDSRDVIARIEELEGERDDFLTDEQGNLLPGDTQADWLATEEGQELAALKAFAEEVSDYAADWQYGEACIRDTYFTKYAQQLAEDIGAINADATWPNNCIDWEEAARLLKQDYTSVDFAGVTYWIR